MGAVGDFLRKVSSRSQTCRSEAELAHLFLSELEILSKSIDIDSKARMEETVLRGRNDARIGCLAFEFKKPGRLDSISVREGAIDELILHLQDYVSGGQFLPNKIFGFITDGVQSAMMRYDDFAADFITVNQYDAPIPRAMAYVPIEATSLWLYKNLKGLGRRALTPENLLEDFGPGSDLCRLTIPALWNAFQKNVGSPRLAVFYRQWSVLFSLTTQKVASAKELSNVLRDYGLGRDELGNEEHVRQFLFVLHTYYSTLLKLLAVHVSDDLQLLGSISLLEGVVNDTSFGLRRAEESLPKLAVNLVERDILSWFEEVWDIELQNLVGQLAKRFQDYDVGGVGRDVFKRVYQNIIPAKLRKALGEFYTKDWAAEFILNEIGYDGSGSILDPACGSGTFLALAIKRKKTKLSGHEPGDILRDILGSVVGYDANPIAVTTARINYLLSIEDLIHESRISGGIEIPVFLADSVIIPSESYDVTHGITYELHTAVDDLVGTIRLPFGKSLKGFQNGSERVLLGLLESHVRSSSEKFLEAVKREFGAEYETQFRPILRSLHSKMVELDKKGVNGIWARLIQNYFAPVFAPKFDFVVGNPPWVAPVHVPKGYRDLVKQVIKKSGFMEPYEPSFRMAKARFPGAEEQYVACLPFLHLALSRYLKENGKCAFLLTSSLMRLLNAGGLRESLLKYRLEKIIDLTLMTDIHEGASCWAFVPVVVNTQGAIDASISYAYTYDAACTGRTRKRSIDLEEQPKISQILWRTNGLDLRLDPRNMRSPWIAAEPETMAVFRKMQRFPRLGDQYRINMGIKTSVNDLFFLKDLQKSQEGYVLAKNLAGEPLHIEEQMISPVCKGTDIRPWSFKPEYMVLPHLPPKWKAVPEDMMRTNYPETYEYFSRNRVKLEKRTDYGPEKGPFYMIFRLSESKSTEWKVTYRDISTQLEACVLPDMIQSLVGNRNLIVDHSAYFISTNGESESHYVSGLLNSLPCRAFVQGLGRPKGGVPFIGIVQWMVASLPVPRFDPSEATHTEISTLSRAAHSNPLTADSDVIPALNEAVSSLYDINDKELNQLARHFHMLRGELVVDLETR